MVTPTHTPTGAPSERAMLYDYQERGLADIFKGLDEVRRVMYTLPTGGGKTYVGVAAIQRWLKAKPPGTRGVWLAHRDELESQAQSDLDDIGLGSDLALVSSPIRLYNAVRSGRLRFGKNDILVIDEAHHATAETWSRVILEWSGVVLGLTATPWRLSKAEGFDHLYHRLVIGPSKRELIRRGRLVESVVKQPRGRSLIRGRGRSGGDYSVTETMKQSQTVLVERGVDWLIRWSRINGRKLRTIVYALNISHAKSLREYAASQGIRAAVLTAETSTEERRRVVDDFRAGRLWVLINVAILTEGFDVKGADAVLLLRPTASLALYLQMCGRANREAPGKNFALILDATDNVQRLGHPDRDQHWSLAARGEGGGSAPPTRCCHKCQTVQDSGRRHCSTCEASFGIDCPRCGWVWGLNDGAKFKLPEINEETGMCDRCSIEQQDRLFRDHVMTEHQFIDCFTKRDERLVFYDPEMTNTYWISLKPDMRGWYRGGVYVGDPTARRHLPPEATRINGRTGSRQVVFHRDPSQPPASTVSGRNAYDVMRHLYDLVYRPVAESISESIRQAQLQIADTPTIADE